MCFKTHGSKLATGTSPVVRHVRVGRCCLWAFMLNGMPLLAENLPNADFESGQLDGWVVGGRKDAQAKVIPSGPMFDQLNQSRLFRSTGGCWAPINNMQLANSKPGLGNLGHALEMWSDVIWHNLTGW